MANATSTVRLARGPVIERRTMLAPSSSQFSPVTIAPPEGGRSSKSFWIGHRFA